MLKKIWLASLVGFGLLQAEESSLQIEDRYQVCGDLDYLLWFVNQDGLSYTTSGESTNCSTNVFLNERDQFLTPGWNSGGRFLIDLSPGPVKWDSNLSYLFYFANSKKSIETTNNSLPTSNAPCFSEGTLIVSDEAISLYETFPGSISFDVLGKWKLFFNRIDWEFGRKIPFGTDFTFRPFFGIEAAGIDQKLHETVTTIYSSLQNGSAVSDVVEIRNKALFLGIGSKTGFSGIFHLGKGFGFYGSASGSILWGHFHIHQDYTETDYYEDNTSVQVGGETLSHSHNASVFNCDLAIGVNWKRCFNKSHRTLGLKLGWEEHFYTNINRFQNFYIQDIANHSAIYSFDRNLQKGNLSLSGFTIGILLNY